MFEPYRLFEIDLEWFQLKIDQVKKLGRNDMILQKFRNIVIIIPLLRFSIIFQPKKRFENYMDWFQLEFDQLIILFRGDKILEKIRFSDIVWPVANEFGLLSNQIWFLLYLMHDWPLLNIDECSNCFLSHDDYLAPCESIWKL